MLRLGITAVCALLVSVSYGQLKKFYTLKETSRFDTVQFTLEATAGECLVQSTEENSGPLSIYGNPDLDKINPSFKSRVINNTCVVNLDLEQYRSSSFSDGIIFAMMRSDDHENYWKVLLDQEKIYRLNLNYGFGNANVDLSGTSVQNFKVQSGSADVVVGYKDGQPNRIVMDTFYVKVDMGSIIAHRLELARARYVNANIGFGRALLDFSNKVNEKCFVEASVGAGNLDIFLPHNVPTIIHVKDSPLCGIELAEGFEEVEKNVFVNMDYSANADDLMSIEIDVALGNVAFHYSD